MTTPLANETVDGISAFLSATSDDETLAAALSFVDSFETQEDVAFNGLGVPFEAEKAGSVTQKSVADSKKSSGRKRRQRPTPKQELEYLYETAATLEKRLAELKDRHQQRRGQDPVDPVAHAWKQLTTHQREERQRVEVENMRLRSKLEDQLRLIKSLERILKKRGDEELFPPESEMDKHRLQGPFETSPIDLKTVEDELKHSLDDMFDRVDTVFNDPRFSMTERGGERLHPSRVMELRADEKTGAVIETLDTSIFPFDYRETVDAIWEFMLGQVSRTPASPQIQHDTSTGDVTTNVFDGHFNILDNGESVRAKMASRRVIESNRVLLLATVLMDPSSVDRKSTGGLYLRTRLWQVLRPTPDHETSQGKASVRQIFHEALPELYDVAEDTVNDDHVKAGNLTNFVLRSLNAHMDVSIRQVESILLDRLARITIQDE